MRQLQFISLILLLAIPCTAGVIYVDSGGTGSGTSWHDPNGVLQWAINNANSNDEVWVAAGTYKPTIEVGGSGDRYKTFQMKNGVKIYGGFPDTANPDMADRDPNQYETILSGDIGTVSDNSDNCYHVFYHPEGTNLDVTAILDGFTITGGKADGPGYPDDHRSGGGMYNDFSSPTVVNCTFSGNVAGDEGGGMYNYMYSSPTVTDCTFTGNSAYDFGGGMFNYRYSSPTVTGCTFVGNWGDDEGGGMCNINNSNPTVTGCTFTDNSAWRGGGMCNNWDSYPTVISCTFGGNWAYSGGGGMCNFDNSSSTVTNCTFNGNSAWRGGGMYNSQRSSSPIVTGCTFTGNAATGSRGGGMYNGTSSSPIVTGCTFTGNSAWEFGGGMHNWQSSPTLANCILWGNTAASGGNEIALRSSSTIDVDYCDVQGGQAGIYDDLSDNTINWGGDNIDADPLFVDPNGADGIIGTEDDNLRLSAGSPCIDVGDNSAVDPNGIDLDGNPRIMNDVVDMGAYEILLSLETDVHIIPRVINRNNRLKRIMAIIRLPEGIDRHDIANEPFVLEPGGIEATWQRVIGRPGRVSVFAFFSKDELMELVSGNGPVELTVTGKLVSGRCIYGSDTIRIIQPRRRRARWRRR